MTDKICTGCKLPKDHSEFTGKQAKCKSCRAKESKTWRDKNPNKVKSANKHYRSLNREKCLEDKKVWAKANPDKVKGNSLKKFWPELTQEERLAKYELMFNSQNGCCKICNRPRALFKKDLAVDHNHLTNKVRALLCEKCNVGLGSFSDSPEWLRAAADYIEDWP